MLSSEEIRKFIFMNYKEVLQYFKENNIRTKADKEITHMELRAAIQVMLQKHPSCRWRSEKIKKRYYYLQYEAVIWLRDVYFNNYETDFLDKDIQWFKDRICWYQNSLSNAQIEFPKFDLKIEPMTKLELAKFFDKDISVIRKALLKMEKDNSTRDRNYLNGKRYLSVSEIEWLLKNKFKKKYLELLEAYKMQLTEIAKANGSFYDNYFGRN